MKSRGKLVLFFLGIFLGILIATNLNLSKFGNSFGLSSKEYSKATMEKRNLVREIEDLNRNNDGLSKEILRYGKETAKGDKAISIIKKQAEYYSMISGSSSVEGPGIKVEITDGKITENDTDFQIQSKIFHDSDMAKVIDEFKTAGAEAISINDYRVTGNTGVMCNWAFLMFQDKETIYAPFSIYGIGDAKKLEASLLSEGSSIIDLQRRGLSIKIEKMEKIIMPSAKKLNNLQYSSEYINK